MRRGGGGGEAAFGSLYLGIGVGTLKLATMLSKASPIFDLTSVESACDNHSNHILRGRVS